MGSDGGRLRVVSFSLAGVIGVSGAVCRAGVRRLKPPVLALALLLAVAWPGIAYGDGGIRVVSQSYENRFPKELVFRVQAEADQEIRKLILYYRMGNSKSTAYAYPSFTPGIRIQGDYTLRNNGGRIVPGSELDYYYVIERC